MRKVIKVSVSTNSLDIELFNRYQNTLKEFATGVRKLGIELKNLRAIDPNNIEIAALCG